MCPDVRVLVPDEIAVWVEHEANESHSHGDPDSFAKRWSIDLAEQPKQQQGGKRIAMFHFPFLILCVREKEWMKAIL